MWSICDHGFRSVTPPFSFLQTIDESCTFSVGEVPWLYDILWHLPIASRNFNILHGHAARLTMDRITSNCGTEDICSHLFGEHGLDIKGLPFEGLVLDMTFAIIAGSDATSSVMTFVLMYVLSQKGTFTRLRDELLNVFPDGNMTFNHEILAKLPFLNAVIEESLRLGTPFPGLRRVVPPLGAIIADRFIPGGTVVSIPGHSQQLSEENFKPNPRDFMPERWLGELGDEAVCQHKGLFSWSFGPFSCLGRELAYRELRFALACLCITFDLHLAPGFDKENFIKGMRNLKSTIFQHPLRIIAHRRDPLPL